MHPLLKRILLNGALTAAVLAGLGLLMTHFATMLTPGAAVRPGAPGTDQTVTDSIRGTVPVMMAFWGFVFVAACEVARWGLWGRKAEVAKAAITAEPRPDDAEKLLNELLAQADAKMAAEKGAAVGAHEAEARSS